MAKCCISEVHAKFDVLKLQIAMNNDSMLLMEIFSQRANEVDTKNGQTHSHIGLSSFALGRGTEKCLEGTLLRYRRKEHLCRLGT